MKMLNNFSSTHNPWSTMLVMSLMLSQRSLPFGPSGLARLQSTQWSVCSALHPQVPNGNAVGDGVKSLTEVKMCYSHSALLTCVASHLVEGNEVGQVWYTCEIPCWVSMITFLSFRCLGIRSRRLFSETFPDVRWSPVAYSSSGPAAHLFLRLALWQPSPSSQVTFPGCHDFA